MALDISRRRILVSGMVGLGAIAGCVGQSEGPTESTSSTVNPTATSQSNSSSMGTETFPENTTEIPTDTPTTDVTVTATQTAIGSVSETPTETPTASPTTPPTQTEHPNKDDVEGPVIQDFTIDSDSYVPGDVMTIEVDVIDETSIERIYFRFEHTDDGGAVFDAYRDFSPPVKSGTYKIQYEWPEDTPGGTYEATWILARDAIGNRDSWEDSFETTKKQIEISSEQEDTEPPRVQDFTILKSEYDAGDRMEIEAEVTDDSGIDRIYFRFEHVDGGGAVFDAYQDYSPPVDSGTYTIEYEWPTDTPSGTYEATWIYARDSIGNRENWADSFPPSKKQVEVNSENTDTEGPVIEDFTIPQDSFSPGELMQIDADVTDETGIERIYFRFENVDGGGAVFDAYRDFSPPVDSGTYTVEYRWPENTPAGTYEATWIYARDSIGNNANWTDSFSTSKKRIEIQE